MSKTRVYSSLISVLFLFLLSVLPLHAQRLHVKGRLIVEAKDMLTKKFVEDKDEMVGQPIYYFNNAFGAKEFMAAYNEYKRSKSTAPFQADGSQLLTMDNGVFETKTAMVGYSFVAIYRGQIKMVEVTEKNYDKLELRFTDSESEILGNVDVTAKTVARPGIKTGKVRAFGRNVVFNVAFEVPENYWIDNARLFIMPVAIDCQNSDTVSFLKSCVSDAGHYHSLQNSRMRFDFDHNDPVNFNDSYVDFDSLEHSGGMITVQYSVPFIKPNEKQAYACRGRCVIEDLTHTYYSTDGEFGSCFESKPFRFFAWNIKGGAIPFNEQLYEPPSIEPHNENYNLPLQFKVGTSTMIEDSVSTEKLNKFIKLLKRLGTNLESLSVMGGASPEGNVATNTRLARERTNVALQLIKNNLPGWQRVNMPPPESTVYTWENVVDSLMERGDSMRAEQMRDLIRSNANVWASVREDSIINTIINNMRVMRFSYSYVETRPLEADEALRIFREDKNRERIFTHGDYYNILTQVEDNPLEFRKVVERAYSEICDKDLPEQQYNNNKFAMFLANQMAIYSLESDKPDTTILFPFLDASMPLNAQKQIGMTRNYRLVNREELVATEASIALKLMCVDYASFWASKLPQGTSMQQDLELYQKFINAILRWDDPSLPPEEKQAGIDAGHEFMKRDDVNNAVLHVELMEEFGFKREEAVEAVERLNDTDPRKWYLLGVLKAVNAGQSVDILKSEFEDYGTGYIPLSEAEALELSNEEIMEHERKRQAYENAKEEHEREHGKVEAEDIPQFLGYLQNAFDLAPSYKAFYASESLVPKGIYEKYMYNPRKANKYRKKFQFILRQRETDRKKAAAQAAKAAEPKAEDAANTEGASVTDPTTTTPADGTTPAAEATPTEQSEN